MIDIPLQVARPPTLPPTARQLHGAVSALLREPAEDHHAPVKVFSAWPLHASERDPGTLRVRVGWLPEGPPPLELTRCHQQWRIGSLLATAGAPSVTRAQFADLAATPAADGARFHFHTPTVFARSGRRYPLPDPVLVLRSVLERWNTFAGPFALDDGARREFLGVLELRDFDIRPERMLLNRVRRGDRDHEDWRLGFVGRADIGVVPGTGGWPRRVLAALGRYAGFTGVGAGTTEGFGTCHVDLLVEGDAGGE